MSKAFIFDDPGEALEPVEGRYSCVNEASTRHAWAMFRWSLAKGAGERDPEGAAKIERHIRAAAKTFGVTLPE